ncbi:MAG: TIGR04255 family protein [Pseudomonadota bacterium]
MSGDFLFENAPLVEVIAEVHWELKALGTNPGAKIDPYYDLFQETFLSELAAQGLGHRQELIPSMVPKELVGGQPHLRIRNSQNSWPLTQIGPGLLTANIVPPYKGWTEFQPFLNLVIEKLKVCYPLADKTLKIRKLHLRYIDAFGENFGMQNFSEFATNVLGINAPISTDFMKNQTIDPASVSFVSDVNFINQSPSNSTGGFKLAPGTSNGRNAAILEHRCDTEFADPVLIDPAFILNWFNEAHETMRNQFLELSKNGLIDLMGKQIPLEN